ncbi:MAG: UDP-GlcNAc:undecaprenyl-phosphate GlcNAc-1-phosphate transferase [Litorivivens sp.]
MSLSLTYLLEALFLIGASVALNFLLLRFLRSPGTKNQAGTMMVRWSAQAKPAIGGIGFFVIFLIALIFALLFFGDTILPNEKGLLLGLASASTLGFLAGLYDDSFNTKPFFKLTAQVICASILIASGFTITLFDSDVLNIFVSMVWIVGFMNSINMLDNMDGISTIVSIFVVFFCLIVLGLNGLIDTIWFSLLLGVLASLFGFLVFNWHPSKMFMGDSGSQFLGVLLAAIGILFCWNNEDMVQATDFNWQALVLLALVFLLPLIDTTVVTINRLSHGQSPMVGGRDHTTHNLVYLGFSDRMVGTAYSFLSMVHITIAVWITYFISDNQLWMIWLAVGYMLCLFFTLFVISRVNLARGKYSYR